MDYKTITRKSSARQSREPKSIKSAKMVSKTKSGIEQNRVFALK